MASLLKSSVSSYATFAPLSLPSASASPWLARATFAHARPLLDAGSQRRVELEDLWPLEAPHRASASFGKFQQALERTQSVRRALLATVGLSFALCGLGNGALAACALFAPVVRRRVVDAFSGPVVDMAEVCWWVAALFATRLVNAFLEAHVNFLTEMMLMEMTVSLKALVFQKILRRSLQSKRDASAGSVDVSNIVTADIDNLMWASYSINSVWILPIQIAVVVYLLYDVLDLAAFAGLAVIFLSMGLSHFVATRSKQTFDEMMKFKDSRMQVIKEVFGAIQVVKLNAWEGKFFERIHFWRDKELRAVTKYLYVVAVSVFLLWSTPLAVSVTSFATYALLMGQTLTAAKVFTAMVLFNAIRDPLSQFPGALQSFLQASSAVDRIAKFLDTEEVSDANFSRDATEFGDNVEIAVQDGAFSWHAGHGSTEREKSKSVLRNVSVQIRKGDFVVIHGAVGSGKSSLVAALLGELPAEQGTVFVRSKSIAFYTQQPWIQNMTIRENILFGLPYDKAKYDRVLNACGLTEDIDMFPAGDQTEIGHKGVNLSGGQKARVSLARACYSEADVFILDTPLAAVDAVVQTDIFNKCICDLLEHKTVVLVTHLQDIIESPAANVNVHVENHRTNVSYNPQTNPRSKYAKLSTEDNKIAGSSGGVSSTTARADGQFVEQEGRQGGLVSGHVFQDYIQALGGKKAIFVFMIVLALWQGFQISSDVWLSRWTGSTSVSSQSIVVYNLTIYAALGLATSLFVLLRALAVAFVGTVAARRLFDGMTRSLLNAPMRFFDTNPIGRILNRYAEDISMIDFRLPPVFFGAFVVSAMNAFQLLTAVYVIKFAGLLLVPLCWVYIRLGGFYFTANLEVSRLRKVTTSPVLTHIAQSEEGVATLRAFGSLYTTNALEEHFRRIDENNRAWYAQTVISQWFALRVQLIGVGVVVIVVSSLLALHEYLSPGLIGLAFMYVMNVDQQLGLGLKSWLWLEMYLVSPERVLEYIDIAPEGSLHDSVIQEGAAWPRGGSLKFENVQYAYEPGGDLILKGLSFEIKHNEKIGIVGRTGAGKSSLTMALFRVNELSGGRILFDGVDIATINLHLLRSSMSIIPQVPILFKGSLRAYMDPFDEYTDANIWSAFEKVGMKDAISALEGKLAHELSENGENFSVGERQLLCLSRALLRKSRVVVMDEATASIDVKTEQKLQLMIAREFVDATVLTIAHRLSTVVASDRILVLRDGVVAEFDAPRALAQKPDGVFRAFAAESGCLSQLLN